MALVALAALALAVPGTAGAAFLPGAKLLSVSPERGEQADARTLAVDISQDGRYVVFQTQARNLFAADYQDPPGQFRQGGIFRSDRETGALQLVALGDLLEGTNTVRRGAQNPSINGDGRYVSFSSADQLVAADVNTRIDVYVRDMDQPFDSPTAFELVSARDGGDQPATYGGIGVTGTQVTVDSALSADGRKVVFGTQALSDLPAADLPTTPARQLLVRDLDAHSTTLVTRNMLDGTAAGGAGSSALAAISADGSTVVWAGQSALLQTRMQPGELPGNTYYFWRRVADGPAATTRRITGAVDVDDPGCLPTQDWISDETLTGPCYGPLGLPEDTPQGSLSGEIPTLTADGTRVAFLAAPSVRGVPTGNQRDAFVTDMTAGITRKAGILELTRESAGDPGDIRAIKVSADGRRIAFVTTRIDFLLPTPRLVSPPPDSPKPELYVVDLDRMEIERISSGHDGGDIDGGVGEDANNVAISGDGRAVAFTSIAGNLFPGDANQVADAFVASEDAGNAGDAGPQEPPFTDITPREDADQSGGPALPVSLRRGPGGGVRVTVKAPRAGSVVVTARARVKSGRRTRLRPIAKARKRVRRAGKVTLTLQPERRYRRYLKRKHRLRSRLEIRFVPAAGGRAMVARRTASFTS